MPTVTDEARIQRLIRRQTRRLRAAFERAVRRARTERPLSELARLVEAGREAELLAIADRVGTTFASEVSAAFLLAGEDTAAFLAGALNIQLAFDQTNFAAVQILREGRFDLIREFSNQQRQAVREALTEGTEAALNPRAQARRFRRSIGLTARQGRAVQNFERMLSERDAEALTRQLRDRRFDPTVRRAIDLDEPLSREQIRTMTTRYRQRMLQFRSETIARTEALRAVHEGSETMYAQAIEAGHLSPDQLVTIWNTAADDRVRDSHVPMNGQEQPIGVPFVSGAGNLLRFPGDPNAPAEEVIRCRCVKSTRVTVLDSAAALA